VKRPVKLPGTPRQRWAVGIACGIALVALVVGLATRTTTPQLSAKRPVHVTAPNVVGDSPAAASDKLSKRRLGRRFTVLSSASVDRPCAGLPPAGHIVAQHPPPASRMKRDDRMALQVSCPKGPLPPCQPHQVAMRTQGLESGFPGTAGAWLVEVFLTHIAGPPCELESAVSVQLFESDGTLAAIAGNPSTYSLHQRTGLGEEVDVTWYLGGHIFPKRRLAINAQVGGWSATGHVRTPVSDPGLRSPGLRIGETPRGSPVDTSVTAQAYEAALVTTRAYLGTRTPSR
jgi:hypothetical protein